MTEPVALTPVERVEMLILVDNSLDILLPSTDVAQRAPLRYDWSVGDQLRAEHGFSALVTVEHDGSRSSVLYDAGLSRGTALHNMDVLEVRPADLRAIVLSHGHADHHSGLEGIADRLGVRRLPLVLHPDAWRERRIVFPNGHEIAMPPPRRADLGREGVEFVERRDPSLLVDGTVLVAGETARVTDFETGFPLQQARGGDGWEPDTWIWDDQAVIVHVRGRGLVICSACSHSGAINVIRHAQRVTGVDEVLAFVGGLHLTGGLFEPIIPRTIAELGQIDPTWVVPGHCTGYKASQLLASDLPGAYVHSSVGTTLVFATADASSRAPSRPTAT